MSQQAITIWLWKLDKPEDFFFFSVQNWTKVKVKSKGTHLCEWCDNMRWKDSGEKVGSCVYLRGIAGSLGGIQSCCCGQGEAVFSFPPSQGWVLLFTLAVNLLLQIIITTEGEKKTWRKVNCTSPSTHNTCSYHLSPLTSPWFAVLQTITPCFSSLS